MSSTHIKLMSGQQIESRTMSSNKSASSSSSKYRMEKIVTSRETVIAAAPTRSSVLRKPNVYNTFESLDPNDVIIKRRVGEGSRPLFERDDITVNDVEDETPPVVQRRYRRQTTPTPAATVTRRRRRSVERETYLWDEDRENSRSRRNNGGGHHHRSRDRTQATPPSKYARSSKPSVAESRRSLSPRRAAKSYTSVRTVSPSRHSRIVSVRDSRRRSSLSAERFPERRRWSRTRSRSRGRERERDSLYAHKRSRYRNATSRERDLISERDLIRKHDLKRERDLIRERYLKRERDLIRDRDLIRERDLKRERDLIRERDLKRERDLIRQRDLIRERDFIRRELSSTQISTIPVTVPKYSYAMSQLPPAQRHQWQPPVSPPPRHYRSCASPPRPNSYGPPRLSYEASRMYRPSAADYEQRPAYRPPFQRRNY